MKTPPAERSRNETAPTHPRRRRRRVWSQEKPIPSPQGSGPAETGKPLSHMETIENSVPLAHPDVSSAPFISRGRAARRFPPPSSSLPQQQQQQRERTRAEKHRESRQGKRWARSRRADAGDTAGRDPDLTTQYNWMSQASQMEKNAAAVETTMSESSSATGLALWLGSSVITRQIAKGLNIVASTLLYRLMGDDEPTDGRGRAYSYATTTSRENDHQFVSSEPVSNASGDFVFVLEEAVRRSSSGNDTLESLGFSQAGKGVSETTTADSIVRQAAAVLGGSGVSRRGGGLDRRRFSSSSSSSSSGWHSGPWDMRCFLMILLIGMIVITVMTIALIRRWDDYRQRRHASQKAMMRKVWGELEAMEAEGEEV